MDLRFALNHMVARDLGVREFFALARQVGLTEVEIRNDLNGVAARTSPRMVRDLAAEAGVRILSLNALQRFDDWTGERAAEATEQILNARMAGAEALILVPSNDGSQPPTAERLRRLRDALAGILPMLRSEGVIGLIEPLGFATCSLRSKREAVAAIADVGGEDTFRVTHDTFHHALAGEPDLFAASTGLVHISGVEDPGLALSDMRDAHRVLVGPRDRIGNIEQIRALLAAGYQGAFSFEPFAEELRALPDLAQALRASMQFIKEECAATAA